MLLLNLDLLHGIDWTIIIAFFVISLLIGLWVSRKAGSSAAEFFLSGRNMPWWLLGISMVATTFSADTPNLVTDIVRRNGVAGNWEWWAFLLTGMLTVFVYAKLWRRSKVLTDVEFYELRYSGRPAAFLRGFRALYLGLFFNVMIMASVSLAAIKIGYAMLGLAPWETLFLASVVTVAYSALGGLRGVMITDFFQFFMALIGAIGAAYIILGMPEVRSLEGLLQHAALEGKLSLIPDFEDTTLLVSVFIIPLAVQWWSVWYPGAEPGGGGYIVQRILSAKNERHAMGATLFFNAAHYALRPWPWILIALASLVVFPMTIDQENPPLNIRAQTLAEADSLLASQVGATELQSLQSLLAAKIAEATGSEQTDYQRLDSLRQARPDSREIKSLAYIVTQQQSKGNSGDPLKAEQLVFLQLANPHLPIDKLGNDIAYPTMLLNLPAGLLGLVIASLIAAYMSTISTQLNWGSSYIVNDYYKRFLKPQASEKELVGVGRISTVLLMVLSALFALVLENALDTFKILLQIGAGTGLIFILRWFWWRINAWSEIVAMIVSFVFAIYTQILHTRLFGLEEISTEAQLLMGVGVTTLAWILATYYTRPTDQATLRNFYRLIKPGGPGWKSVVSGARTDGESLEDARAEGQLPLEILCMVIGCLTVYGALFATGYWIYGNILPATILTVVAGAGAWFLFRVWGKLRTE